jgi:O-antigen/teichoic acid export membrane protein
MRLDSLPGIQNKVFTSRLYSNSIYLILNSGIGAGLGFFFWFFAARFTTPEQVGTGSALVSAAGLLSFFGSMGLGFGLMRFLPSSKAPVQMINNSLTMTAATTIILSSVFILGLPFWNPTLAVINRNPVFSIVFIILTAVLAMMVITSQTFVSYQRANLSASQTLIFGLVKVGLVIVLITIFQGFGIFMSWGIGAVLAVTISLFIFLPRLQPGYHLYVDFSNHNRNIYKFSIINSAAEGLWI